MGLIKKNIILIIVDNKLNIKKINFFFIDIPEYEPDAHTKRKNRSIYFSRDKETCV